MKNQGETRRGQYFAMMAALAALLAYGSTGLAQTVIAWGSNGQGQTNVPSSATNVIAVAAGWYHSLALRSDGAVISWGAQTNVPDGLTNAKAIAAGAYHSLALQTDGSVVAWGDNTYFQTNVPDSATNLIALASGDYHSIALKADGTVVAWGRNDNGQTNVPAGLNNVVAIAAGTKHSVALLDDGTIVTWGQVSSHLRNNQISAVVLAAGGNYTMALGSNSRITQWGDSDSQSILTGITSYSNVVGIAASTNFAIVLLSYGGIGVKGFGIVTNIPSSATNIFTIAAGYAHGLALKGDGSPRILSLPAYQAIVSAGNFLPLAANAVSSKTINYQWLIDGVPLSTNSRTPMIVATYGSDNVAYQVIASNSLGSVTSSVSKVSVRSLNMWGWKDYANKPYFIPRSVINPAVITAGAFHNLALQEGGTVVAWGKNADGQTNVPVGATNIMAVAAGSDHSLALKNNGTVIAWGKNWDGQTNVPPAATNVVAIAAGWAHSAALRADGTVVSWGNNDYGQNSVSFLANQVTAIAAGYYHTLALRADGTVASWGDQTEVPATATNVIAIAAGWGHNLALRADGTVLGWGDNTFGQATIPPTATNVIAVSAGWYHSMVLRKDGTLIQWGKAFKRSFITNTPAGLTNLASIDAGEDYSTAVVQTGIPRLMSGVANLSATPGGQLFYRPAIQGSLPMTYQWTRNGAIIDGQTNSYLLIPTAQPSDGGSYELIVSNQYGSVTNAVVTYNVTGSPKSYSAVAAWGGFVYDHYTDIPPGTTDPVAIAAGSFHNLVLQRDGSVAATGSGHYGETNIPPDLTNTVAIAAGYYHNLALRSDNSVIAWGKNFDGQTNVPATATNVIAIAARSFHSMALRADGTVIAWGNNFYNQTNVPEQLNDVIAVAAGYQHNLALRSDLSVISWGSQYLVPASANGAISIAAGFEHSLALKPNGSVVAWGNNSFGQCNVPASVTNAVAIAAGMWHSAALLDDGRVAAWGQNGSAVFTNANSGSFVLVTNIPNGLRNVTQIACGEHHVLATVTYGAPQIDVTKPAMASHVGCPTLFTAVVGGTGPLKYQWYRGSSPIAGATNRWLQNPNVQLTDADSYTLVASNGISQTTSAPTVYAVEATPYFLTPLPTHQNALVGTPLNLAVQAGGEQPLAYQAQLNDANMADNGRISGTGGPNLFFNPTAFGDSGVLTMIITNSFGAYTGLVANLAVTPVIGWGDNSEEQLQVPATVTNVTALASGGDHNLALLTDGRVVAWGDNTYNQNDVPIAAQQAVAIAEGDSHSLALKADGSVIAWGDNSAGQTNVPGTVQNALAIAAGDGFSLALLPDGSVIRWGINSTMSGFTNVMLLSTKGTHSIGLKGDGTIVDNMNSSVTFTNVISICAGIRDGLGLRADGSLVAWGKGEFGQTNVPTAASNIVAIAAGEDHFVALRADGVAIAWGSMNYYQCPAPTLAQSIGLISAGSIHSLAALGQPLQRTATAGSSVTFSASQYGNRLATYQWQFNGTDIVGATNSTLILGNVNWTNNGLYRAVISNTVGVITSPAMSVSVGRTPLVFDTASLSYQPTNGAFQVRLTGSSGVYPVVIYASTNLSDWTPVFTNNPTTNNIDIQISPTEPSWQKFYRAIEQP